MIKASSTALCGTERLRRQNPHDDDDVLCI
jgi:hypothetical protein